MNMLALLTWNRHSVSPQGETAFSPGREPWEWDAEEFRAPTGRTSVPHKAKLSDFWLSVKNEHARHY
jgi:hypothetical protein